MAIVPVWMFANLVLFLFSFFSGETLSRPVRIVLRILFLVSFVSMPFVTFYVFMA